MNDIAQKINYFRSCFEADNRSLQLLSFFSSKVSYSKVLEDSDLLTGRLPYLPVSKEWGEKALKKLTLYSKEKSLYCCAFFVFGQTYVFNKKQKLIAPLLLYPATIEEEDELHKVTLTSNTPILNPAAVASLKARNSSLNAFNELSNHIPTGRFQFEEGVLLKEVLDDLFENLDSSTLDEYPTIASPKQIDRLRKSNALFQEDQFHLISTIGLGVLDKTKSGRGVLNELKNLAEAFSHSFPINELFQLPNQSFQRLKDERIFVPVTLNDAQKKLIVQSYSSPLSVAIGPPGTGKSFTIAALTIDAVSRGESVLIASNNYQAVDVIAKKLEKDFNLGHKPVKTTDKKWKALVIQRLQNILSGIGVEQTHYSKVQDLKGQLAQCINESEGLERIIKARIHNEKKWGLEASKSKRFIWNKIRFGLYRMRANKVAPLWELYDDLQRKLRYKNHLIKAYIRTANDYYLYEMLQRSRKELQVFLKGLRARTGSLKEERFKQVNFDTLFSALPIWLVTMEEVSQVLPLEKELFDVVIFDEATQCNISSALPILQRGKRAVIVGDPKQLRHISFLSTHRQEQLLKQYNLPPEDIYDLDYRNRSLLDFTLDQMENQRDIHFLNEHYRSLPDLINFSNQRFYDSAISLMTDTPTAKTEGNLHLVPVNGKRVGKGVNEIEIQAIIEQVKSITERDKSLDPTLCKTIGVLSPFREQSNSINKAIQAVFSLEQIQRHAILVGTPHFFQGEERDIMLLSFALDDDAHPSAFRYLEKVDVFNVSITRSRIAQYLYISFEPKQLVQESLLKAYLSSIQQEVNSSKDVPNNVEHDVFMEEVVAEIKKLDFQQIYFNYHIANLDIDIVVIRNDKTYCIDLVGYPGEYEAAFPIERINVFNRMDLKVLSIPYLYWTLDQDKCVEAIHRFLKTEEDM